MGNNIVEIGVDLDNDLIKKAILTYARVELSEPSASLLEDYFKQIEDAEILEPDAGDMYEALGRAVFNEILLTALHDRLEREKWMEELEESIDDRPEESS